MVWQVYGRVAQLVERFNDARRFDSDHGKWWRGAALRRAGQYAAPHTRHGPKESGLSACAYVKGRNAMAVAFDTSPFSEQLGREVRELESIMLKLRDIDSYEAVFGRGPATVKIRESLNAQMISVEKSLSTFPIHQASLPSLAPIVFSEQDVFIREGPIDISGKAKAREEYAEGEPIWMRSGMKFKRNTSAERHGYLQIHDSMLDQTSLNTVMNTYRF
jgi:hypothetical protein